MQLINSTDLNILLRFPIYLHLNSQHHAAYLILEYSLMYRSFQSTGKAIMIKHRLLPYIDVLCKGYILSPSERACQEEGWYQSISPPPFTHEDLGFTIAIPTPTDHPWCQRKKKIGNDTVCNPSLAQEEFNIPAAIPLEDSLAEMTLQRGRVTLCPTPEYSYHTSRSSSSYSSRRHLR